MNSALTRFLLMTMSKKQLLDIQQEQFEKMTLL